MAINFETVLAVVTSIVLMPCTAVAVDLYSERKSEEDIRADSMVRCLYQIGEFGADAIDICVKAEDAARAELAAYPDEFFDIVRRCNLVMYQAGWTRIKQCADNDIRARDALSTYPEQQAPLIAKCQEEVGRYGQAQVKECVDEQVARSGEDSSR